ncbi:MAG: DUF3298 domain-containing protein [Romboutsia sp.]
MNSMKNFLKPIIFLTVLILIISVVKQGYVYKIGNVAQTSLYQGLRVVKITEEKSKIEENNISIVVKMPQIHYDNKEVERYINTYIRTDINNYINHQRQFSDIEDKKVKKNISMNYHVPFENSDIINIVIYKNTNEGKDDFELEKDSYVFDLKTGQRIYLDNFLKDNNDYKDVIEKYIGDYIGKNKLRLDSKKIEIDKYTNYIISDGGINIYFNPYKVKNSDLNYEFKIPYTEFKNKIKIVESNNIVANVDTQTITKNKNYINSVINIPMITTKNKKIEKTINDKIKNDIMSFYNSSEDEAKRYFKDYPDTQNKFVVNADFYVKKNSDNMLSIKVEYYKYSGGAHGYYEDVSYNIDMINGEDLTLDKLFKDEHDYKARINKEINNQIEAIVKKDKEYKGIYEFKGINDKQKFYIQDDKIVIYFDLYEIAPYPAGIPEFPIKAKDINYIIDDKYIDIFK